MAISKSLAEASAENLARHSVGYLFVPKGASAGSPEQNASGTLVTIGGRLLLATVAHARPQSVETVHLVKKTSLISSGVVNCVVRRAVDHAADVGVFELAADSISRLGAEPIDIDRVHDAGYGSTDLKACVVGYPTRFISKGRHVKGMTELCGLSYGCEPIDPTRWGTIEDLKETASPQMDVVVEYNPDVVEWGKAMPVPPGLPHPAGMSGGGMWQPISRTPENELWSPERLKLFAIQRSILTRHPFLVATQIIQWLKLVADTYPDLRRISNPSFRGSRRSDILHKIPFACAARSSVV